jgi:hypothetical protein
VASLPSGWHLDEECEARPRDGRWLTGGSLLQDAAPTSRHPDYPFQEGSSLSAAGVNYATRKAAQMLKKMATLSSPKNELVHHQMAVQGAS